MKHSKIFQSLFEQKSAGIGQLQTRSGGKCSTHKRWRGGFYREDTEAKQGNCVIGCSLSSGLVWERLIGCDRLSFSFIFWDRSA